MAHDSAVSVIIATYNHAAYLPSAVESVLAQTFTDFELVIVDDGSTDATPSVIANLSARHPARFRSVRQPNAGAGAAVNRGLDETSAPLVAFLDSDDLWTPDHLATLVELINADSKLRIADCGLRNAECGLRNENHVPPPLAVSRDATVPAPPACSSPNPQSPIRDCGLRNADCELRNENRVPPPLAVSRNATVPAPPTGNSPNPQSPPPVLAFGRRDSIDAAGVPIRKRAKPFATGYVTSALFESMFISKICIVARREAIERAGRFDTALRVGEDYELMLRLSRLGPFVGTDRVVAHRRRHGTNITADTAAYRVRSAALLERFYFKLAGWRDVDATVARKRLAHAHYAAGRKLLAAGHAGDARFHLKRSALFDRSAKTSLLRAAAALRSAFSTPRAAPDLPPDYQFIPAEQAQAILSNDELATNDY